MRNDIKKYFDYAATTPVDKEVEKAMKPFYGEVFGNPSSLHGFGQETSTAIFEARRKIGAEIGANYDEIIFTGSATEANNLALRGIIRGLSQKLKGESKKRIIVSAIEHSSILETAKDLSSGGGSAFGGERNEVEVIYLPVDENGIVDLEAFKKSLNENTVLISIMYANNEVGSIQPIAEISNIIKKFRNQLPSDILHFPVFHIDATQAFNYLDCNVKELVVDLMTLSSHKIYGPKGIGLLYAKKEIQKYLLPIITGGGQEFGLRPGTENAANIVGFAKAIEIAAKMRKKEVARLKKLQQYFWQKLRKCFKDAQLNGPLIGNLRLPNNINIYFLSAENSKQEVFSGAQKIKPRRWRGEAGRLHLPNIKVQDFITALSIKGFAVSGGSACEMRAANISYVLKAMSFDDERAKSGIRITFGRYTQKKGIDIFLLNLSNTREILSE